MTRHLTNQIKASADRSAAFKDKIFQHLRRCLPLIVAMPTVLAGLTTAYMPLQAEAPIDPSAPVEPRSGREIPKLTIGAVFPLSGAQTVFGKEAMRGLDLALAQLRAARPELATKISIVAGDDQSTAKEGSAVAERLLTKERAHVLIGSTSSASTAFLADVARRHATPLVAPLATAGGDLGPHVYRTCFDEPTQGALIAAALQSFADAAIKRSVAILRDDSLGAQQMSERFTQELQARGGTVTASEVFESAQPDFIPPLRRLRQNRTKALFVPASSATALQIAEAGQNLKMPLQFFGSDSWDTPQFAKNAANGHLLVSHFAADDPDPKVQAFVAAFKNQYGRPPGGIAALTYDAFNLLIEAYDRVGSNLKDQLELGLRRTQNFSGVTGDLSFTDQGEPMKQGIIKETHQGRLRFKGRVLAKTAAKPLAADSAVPGHPKQ